MMILVSLFMMKRKIILKFHIKILKNLQRLHPQLIKRTKLIKATNRKLRTSKKRVMIKIKNHKSKSLQKNNNNQLGKLKNKLINQMTSKSFSQLIKRIQTKEMAWNLTTSLKVLRWTINPAQKILVFSH